MQFYLEYEYDNAIHQSPHFNADCLSEIYEQAKHVYQTMGCPPIWVCIYVSNTVVTKLPL